LFALVPGEVRYQRVGKDRRRVNIDVAALEAPSSKGAPNAKNDKN
jgi:hypothetical protein